MGENATRVLNTHPALLACNHCVSVDIFALLSHISVVAAARVALHWKQLKVMVIKKFQFTYDNTKIQISCFFMDLVKI